jgi:hypothetical protein
MSLTLVRIAMSCAIGVVGAVGVFIVLRYVAWMG